MDVCLFDVFVFSNTQILNWDSNRSSAGDGRRSDGGARFGDGFGGRRRRWGDVVVVESCMELVNEISGIGECRNYLKKEATNLVRRLKLLTPMFEELREMKDPLPQENIMQALHSLRSTLKHAGEILKFGHDGSKLFMVL